MKKRVAKKMTKSQKIAIAAGVTPKIQPERVVKPKTVADLTIADVLQMREYYDAMSSFMKELEDLREDARMKAGMRNTTLCRCEIDRLQEKGVWNPADMTVAYAKAMEKRLTGFSSSERAFIKDVGTDVFNKVMAKLIKDEKARNNSNGDDKQ